MKQVFWIACIWFGFIVYGQDTIALQTCLDRVEQNPLQTVSETSEWRASQFHQAVHWRNLLPDLNANAGFITSFGRRLDPFTNTFATSTVNSQSFGFNSTVVLFNGLNYFHEKRMLRASSLGAEIQLESRENELKTQVVELYVLLCKLTVQLRLSDLRIEKYEALQHFQRLLLAEGRIDVVDTLRSQQALLGEQVLKTDVSAALKLKTIQLNFLMGMPLSTTYCFDPASISAVPEKLRRSASFTLERLDAEMQLAASQLKSDRTEYLPALSLSGLLGTGFSTNNKDFLLPGSPTKRYGDQLNQNLYEGIGLYLSVPLFSRGNRIKMKQLHAIHLEELDRQKQLAALSLEKQGAELLQKRLDYAAKLEHLRRSVQNLEAIYSMTLLLYAEGRVSYAELETSLRDWQLKEVELEIGKLDLELVRLVE